MLGARHQSEAQIALKRARDCRAQGRREEAQAILERALTGERRREAPGAEGAFVAVNLGILYLESGRREDAEQALHLAKQWQERSNAPAADCVFSLANLGETQRRLGKYREGEATLRGALRMSETALGATAPETATCLSYLARLQFEVGAGKESFRNRERSLRICELNFGESSDRCTAELLDLVHYARFSNQGKLARELLRRVAAQMQRMNPGASQLLKPLLMHELVLAEYEAGNLPAAAQSFREGLVAAHAAQGGAHGDAVVLHIGLARTLTGSRDYAPAEAEFRAALVQLRAESTPRLNLLYEASSYFSAMLKECGRKQEAAYWASEAKRAGLAAGDGGRGALTIALRELKP